MSSYLKFKERECYKCGYKLDCTKTDEKSEFSGEESLKVVVVTEDVPDRTIVVGNPVRPINKIDE